MTLEFVKRMDAFFEQPYHMKESNLRQGELEKFLESSSGDRLKMLTKTQINGFHSTTLITGIVD